MKELTQIVFLGNPSQLDRIRYLMRKQLPHKVYFLDAKENDDDKKKTSQDMRTALEKELPEWVVKQSEVVKIPFFDFSAAFSMIVSLIRTEAKKGNHVIINVHGGSILVSTAALLAANLTDAKIFWIEPEKYEQKKSTGGQSYYVPLGAMSAREISLPIGLSLPEKTDNHVLIYLHKKGGTVRSQLSAVVQEIGMEKLGDNIKKSSSGVVKLSKTLSRLRSEGFIATKKIGRKSFEITLTPDKGRVVAEVLSLLEEKA